MEVEGFNLLFNRACADVVGDICTWSGLCIHLSTFWQISTSFSPNALSFVPYKAQVTVSNEYAGHVG